MSLSATQHDVHDLNKRIQAYLRAHAQRRIDHERCGPFVAGFDGESDNPFLNYAIPDDDATPQASDIAALIATFARRRRKPRLEYICEAAPRVEAALTAQGFAIEKRYPILICAPAQARDLPMAKGFALERTRSDLEIIAASVALAEAYGQNTPHPDPAIRMVAAGGVMVLARDTASGEVAGAGMATVPHEGVCEVAGIGVRAAYRRRGIAGALTGRIAREAFARGATLAWLTPGDEGPERIYVRAGFARASEQLHISLAEMQFGA